MVCAVCGLPGRSGPPGSADRCPRCGHRTAGETAEELRWVNEQLRELSGRRDRLVRQLAPAPGTPLPPGSPAGAAPGPVRPAAPRDGQRVLLSLGVLALTAAVMTFVAFTWGRLPVAGQVLALVVLTGAVAVLAHRLRVGLPATAEACAALAAVLLVGDLVAARLHGLAGLDRPDPAGYLVGAAVGATIVLRALHAATPARSYALASALGVVAATGGAVWRVGVEVSDRDTGTPLTLIALSVAGGVTFAVTHGWPAPGRAAGAAGAVVQAGAGTVCLAAGCLDDVDPPQRLTAAVGLFAVTAALALLARPPSALPALRLPPLAVATPAVVGVVGVGQAASAWVPLVLAGTGVGAAAGICLARDRLAVPAARVALVASAAAVLVAHLDAARLCATSYVLAAASVLAGAVVGEGAPARRRDAARAVGLCVAAVVAAGSTVIALPDALEGSDLAGWVPTAVAVVLVAGLLVGARMVPVPGRFGPYAVAVLTPLVSAAQDVHAQHPRTAALGAAGAGALVLVAAAFDARMPFLGDAGSALVWVALAITMHSAQVHPVEAYSLPLAAVLVVPALLRRRAGDPGSSWRWAGPVVGAALAPSTVVELEGMTPVRGGLLVLVVAAIIVVGVRLRLLAPVVIASVCLTALAVAQMIVLVAAVPHWIVFAAAGTVLVVAGARYESLRRTAAAVHLSLGAWR